MGFSTTPRTTRHTTMRSSARSTPCAGAADDVWAVVASGRRGQQWYVDAAPFVVRGGIDRVAGGAGRRWDPPGTPLLATGDRAGFWRVVEADHTTRRLVLVAEVRAPGTVTLTTEVDALDLGCVLRQRVTLEPRGLLGAAYLVLDVPAREAVVELTHRRLLGDLTRDVPGDNRSAGPPVDQA